MKISLVIREGGDRIVLVPETDSDRQILGRLTGKHAEVNAVREYQRDYIGGRQVLTEVQIDLSELLLEPPPMPEAP